MVCPPTIFTILCNIQLFLLFIYRTGTLTVMKLLLIAVNLIVLQLVSAQDELLILPTGPGAINQAINGDTLPDGSRASSERIYTLLNDTVYIMDDEIRWQGYNIHLRAKESDEPRPLITGIDTSGTGGLNHLFRCEGADSVKFVGLHFDLLDTNNHRTTRLVRMEGNRGTLLIDHCLIENPKQTVARLQADSLNIKIKNSLCRRIGVPDEQDIPSGSFLDNRGYSIDTLIVENSLVYCATDHFLRSAINSRYDYLRINQSTFWASGRSAFELGQVQNLHFSNNIVANPAFLGETAGMPEYAMRADPILPGASIHIENNNIYTDQAFDDTLPSADFDGVPINSVKGDFFDANIAPHIVEELLIHEEISYTDPPNTPFDFIDARKDASYVGVGNWDFSDLPSYSKYTLSSGNIDRYIAVHDFAYPDTTASYEAGSVGQPLGAEFFVCPLMLSLDLSIAPPGSYRARSLIDLTGAAPGTNHYLFESQGEIILMPTTSFPLGGTANFKIKPLHCQEY